MDDLDKRIAETEELLRYLKELREQQPPSYDYGDPPSEDWICDGCRRQIAEQGYAHCNCVRPDRHGYTPVVSSI